MQITASQICFWDADKRDQLELLHRVKAYPPCVKLTLEMLESHPTPPLSLLFKFSGSTTDMDMQIMLPLGNVSFDYIFKVHSVLYVTCMYDEYVHTAGPPKPNVSGANSGFSKKFSGPVHSTHLMLIKWKDEQRQTHRFYLMHKIENKWRDIGQVLGNSISQLDDMSSEHQGNSRECCRAVLDQWLTNPPPDYPATWNGLIELLEDCQLSLSLIHI